jgi:hypothetical protein
MADTRSVERYPRFRSGPVTLHNARPHFIEVTT